MGDSVRHPGRSFWCHFAILCALSTARFAQIGALGRSVLGTSCHCLCAPGNDATRPSASGRGGKGGPGDIFLITIRHGFQKPAHLCLRPTYPALPQLQHSPPHGQQGILVPGISGDVLVKFALPEFRAGTGDSRKATAGMPMPEAAMHENAEAIARKHQIRLSWEVLLVQAIPEAVPM